ncbi:hypothetical protein Nepgr_025999 [Nepenthes gracilis]|uniref:Secreted protein n=1 Tax=Nepenthes gracilis TaxID=150966 RepID=A0AAD3T908_NEPGR|nr:hypothetical protein Nepgr_025999 [Nepenthes gracilis]
MQWMLMLLLILLQFSLLMVMQFSVLVFEQGMAEMYPCCSLLLFIGWADFDLNVAPTKLLSWFVARVVWPMELGLGISSAVVGESSAGWLRMGP